MRFPSLNNLLVAARESAARFPLVMLAATTAAITAIIGIEITGDDWLHVFMPALLGIPLMFAITVGSEAHARPPAMQWTTAAIATVLLVLYGISLSGDPNEVDITRHLQFTAGLHLLVAFIPFAGLGMVNGFWQYNRVLFIRFVVSLLYSVVLYVGLAVALLAIDNLLGIDIDENIYMHMWFVVAMVFNTWMFIGGVPRDLTALDDVHTYPRGLKVFAQYILVPLVMLYLVILTVYLGKVIVTHEWPSGWIGWLVSSVAVAGILAHLLVFPVREGEGNQWIRSYSRWFYAAMVPSVVMLLMAVGKRIGQYGVTEKRYLLAVLAVWLGGICLYFIFSRTRNIKVIPVTLCAVAFITSFGPWGAFSVSKHSQMKRLQGVLQSQGILVDGAIVPATGTIGYEPRKEISAVLSYIVRTHGVDDIEPWFNAEQWAAVDSVVGTDGGARYRRSEAPTAIMEQMGLEYVGNWASTRENDYFSFTIDPNFRVVPLDGADVMVHLQTHPSSWDPSPLEIDGAARTAVWDSERNSFVLVVDGEEMVFDLLAWAKQRTENREEGGARTLSGDDVRIVADSERARATLYIESINGRSKDGEVTISTANARLFVRWLDDR